jgi:hypothetical protein
MTGLHHDFSVPIRCPMQVFREEVFASLSSIKDKFHFTFINADASPEVVQKVRRLGQLRNVVACPVIVPMMPLLTAHPARIFLPK